TDCRGATSRRALAERNSGSTRCGLCRDRETSGTGQRTAGGTAEVEAPNEGCGLGVLGRVAKIRRDFDHHRILLARAGARAWSTRCTSCGGLGSPERAGTPGIALAARARPANCRA